MLREFLSRRILPFLFLVFFRGWMPWMGIVVVYFNQSLGLTLPQIMVLQSVFLVSIALFEVPTGVFGDRFGRKLSILLADLFFGLGFLVYLFKLPYWVYILGEALMGLGNAFASGATEALYYDTFKELKKEKLYTRFVSLQRSIFLTSLILSGVFTTLALELGFTMRFVWITTLVSFLLSFLTVLFFVKEPQVEEISVELTPDYKKYLSEAIETIKNVKVLKIMVLIFFAFSLTVYLINWGSQPLFLYFKIPVKYYSTILLAAVSIVSIFFHQFLLYYKKHFTFLDIVKILLGVQFLFIVVLLFVETMFQYNLLLVAAYVIYRAISQELQKIIQTFWQPYIKSFNRATVLSGISFIKSLIFAFANLFWGSLLDLHVFWSIVILLILCSGFVVGMVVRGKNELA